VPNECHLFPFSGVESDRQLAATFDASLARFSFARVVRKHRARQGLSQEARGP